MRKYISILLLAIYSLAVSGFVIRLHFCGGDLKAWSVSSDSVSCCCDGGEELAQNNGTDCCSDDEIKLKLDQDYNASVSNLNLLQVAILPTVPTHFSLLEVLADNEITAYNSNAPPGLWENIPLYKLYASYTYYDSNNC